MNKKDYIAPTVFGIIFLAISIFIPFSEANTFSGEIFTFSSLLFGLILTSYSMLFGVIPATKKDFRRSDTLKDISFYFRSCLLVLLISVIFSFAYMLYPVNWLFIINVSLVGVDIGFFGYIIFLVNDIFDLINHSED